MNIWGGGQRQAIAETIAKVLHDRLLWPTAVFVPADSFPVMCGGPQFRFYDEFAGEEAIEKVNLEFAIKIRRAFWRRMENATFGEVVDTLVNLMQK